MRSIFPSNIALTAALLLSGLSCAHAASPDYQPRLFKTLKLIYEDEFNGPLNTEFWEIRQNTAWQIENGVLTGSPSSKEFQEKKKASDDPSHAGLKPVIWLKKVPENFVCALRLRYD